MITIALTKGRVLKETLPLLERVGIKSLEDINSSRKLVFETNHPHIRLLLLRGVDVPTYVQFGSADVGIVGKDLLLETECTEFYEPLDLGIAPCKLMTAGLKGVSAPSGRIKVATKYVNSAARFYASKGRQVDIIKLYGAMELAPVLDLADEIVDIVDTGNTLKANGLEPREFIGDISSRLIVNRASFKSKHEQVKRLLTAFREVCVESGSAS